MGVQSTLACTCMTLIEWKEGEPGTEASIGIVHVILYITGCAALRTGNGELTIFYG